MNKETFTQFCEKQELYLISRIGGLYNLFFETKKPNWNIDLELEKIDVHLKPAVMNLPSLSNHHFILSSWELIDKIDNQGTQKSINIILATHAIRRLRKLTFHERSEEMELLQKEPIVIEFESLKDDVPDAHKLSITKQAYECRDKILNIDFEKTKLFQIKKLSQYKMVTNNEIITLQSSKDASEFYNLLSIDDLEILGW